MAKKTKLTLAQAEFALMCAASERAVSAGASCRKPKSKVAQLAYDLACAKYDEAYALVQVMK